LWYRVTVRATLAAIILAAACGLARDADGTLGRW
jgi:hypothetical protein